MNAYLRIEEYNDSCTPTEKMIADYILHDSAAAIIHFLKEIGFIEFSNLKMNLAQSTKEEKPQEVEWRSFCIYNVASFIDFREEEILITFILVAYWATGI